MGGGKKKTWARKVDDFEVRMGLSGKKIKAHVEQRGTLGHVRLRVPRI